MASPAAEDSTAEDFVVRALTEGECTTMGAIPRASNDTRLLVVHCDGGYLKAVYKPRSGERPLHDFPLGSLAGREVAAYRLSHWLGLDVVPPTVYRTDLPSGGGSLQAYVEAAGADDTIAITGIDEIPPEHAPVFALRTEDDRELIVSHELGGSLRRLAFFDLLANNADRKATHVIKGSYLPRPGMRTGLYGIDNGLTFHPEEKLRTVLWGFSRSSFGEDEIDALDTVCAQPREVEDRLRDCLTGSEISSLIMRAEILLDELFWPDPPEDRTVIPWPPI